MNTIYKRCVPRALYPRGVFQGYYIQEVYSKDTISKRCIPRILYPRGVFQGYYIQEVCSKDTISKRCIPRILYPRGVFQGYYIQEMFQGYYTQQVRSKDTISKRCIPRILYPRGVFQGYYIQGPYIEELQGWIQYYRILLHRTAYILPSAHSKKKKFGLKNLCAQTLVCARIHIFHAYKYVRTNSAFGRWQGIIVILWTTCY